MTGLSQIARGAEGPQRDEALRQAALEAHRAHAFGLESDPAAAVERFAAGLQPLRAEDDPETESFGAAGQAPADRVEYERRAREGWAPPTPSTVQKPEQLGQGVASSQMKDSLGFPSSSLTARDIDRYTDMQNTGEGDEARTPEVIGRDYWAIKKALDVDPNNLAAQDRLNQLDRELDLYPIKKLLGNVAFGEGSEKATGLDRFVRFAGKRAKTVWELFEVGDHLDDYMTDRREIDEIRDR